MWFYHEFNRYVTQPGHLTFKVTHRAHSLLCPRARFYSVLTDKNVLCTSFHSWQQLTFEAASTFFQLTTACSTHLHQHCTNSLKGRAQHAFSFYLSFLIYNLMLSRPTPEKMLKTWTHIVTPKSLCYRAISIILRNTEKLEKSVDQKHQRIRCLGYLW